MENKRDFLISFNQADGPWATWIAWVLEDAGYSVWFQDWDFRGNFVEHMNRAHAQAHRTLAVLSDKYFGSDFTLAEWSARLAEDPAAREDRLVPVKVGPISHDESILRPIIHADLTDCNEDENAAIKRLIERVKKAVDPTYRAKPLTRPGFPGGLPRQVRKRPSFPLGQPRPNSDYNEDNSTVPSPGRTTVSRTVRKAMAEAGFDAEREFEELTQTTSALLDGKVTLGDEVHPGAFSQVFCGKLRDQKK